jgi:hypothetical protein
MNANLLGYSRIPYAAAAQGQFLRPFAHLHRTLRFPDVVLLTIGLLALPAALLPLDAVFNALTTGMVLVQSVAQIVALGLLRARGIRSPYRMWLYPVPALVSGARRARGLDLRVLQRRRPGHLLRPGNARDRERGFSRPRRTATPVAVRATRGEGRFQRQIAPAAAATRTTGARLPSGAVRVHTGPWSLSNR